MCTVRTVLVTEYSYPGGRTRENWAGRLTHTFRIIVIVWER
jgi:hypothetical protein